MHLPTISTTQFATTRLTFALLVSVGCLAPAFSEEKPENTEVTVSPKINLLDVGKGLKKTIRFQVKKGATQQVFMTMRTAMVMSLNGQTFPSPKMPVQRMTLSVVVTDVKPNGDTLSTFEFKAVELEETEGLPAGLLTRVEQQIQPIIGLKGEVEMTSRGINKRVQVHLPENVPLGFEVLIGSIRQCLMQASSAMPEEAVGVGGKWDVIQTLTVNNMTVTQTLTQEIVGFEGPNVKLKTAIAQSAEPQDVQLPGLPPGSKAQLLALESAGNGETLVSTSSIMPNHAKMKGTTKTKIEVNAGGQSQTMDMEMTMEIELVGGGQSENK